MAVRRVEQNAKFQTPPATYNTIISEHLGLKPAAAIHPVKWYPATRDRETWHGRNHLPYLIRLGVFPPCL